MNLFGLTVQRTKATSVATLSPVGNWWNSLVGFVSESYAGAWQENVTVSRDTVLAYSAVYACISIIAQDIGKMRIKLVEQQTSGIWKEIKNAAHSPVLRKPNHFQNRVKFIENWITSKLIHGNSYALKQRDSRGVVTAMYLLDPLRVTPLVSDRGDVFYQLRNDALSNIETDAIVPAREIIHDTMVTLFHPLIGVSPIFACGLAATQGVSIQNNSAKFFQNMSRPSGMLSAPGAIADATAARLKTLFETNFSGENIGRLFVAGDGLKFEPFTINPVDAQLIEQLKWSAETVCSCFHVPSFMIGVGPTPPYANVESLWQLYYSQCLQALIESAELCLDEGLGLEEGRGTEFDLKSLLRMDTATRYKAHSDAIGGGWKSPNEARIEEDLEPVPGGDVPYMQEQNWPLQHLSSREIPTREPTKPAVPALPAPADEDMMDDEPSEDAKMLAAMIIKGLSEPAHVAS